MNSKNRHRLKDLMVQKWRSASWITILVVYCLLSPLLGAAALFAYYPWIEQAYLAAPIFWSFLLVILGTLAVGVALVPTVVLAVFLGYLLGPEAYFLAPVVVTLGVYLGIILGKQLTKHSVQRILAENPKWCTGFAKMSQAKNSDIWKLVFFSRLSPHMPFAATNLIASQLPISLSSAVISSSLGLLPRTLASVAIGQSIAFFDQNNLTEKTAQFGVLFTGLFLVLLFYFVVKLSRQK